MPFPSARIYLVGAGVISRFHARAAQKLPGGNRVPLAIADPNPAARADFSARFPDARVFADAKTMLAEPSRRGDVVVLATPPFTRFTLAAAALRSGRHVLCEKPLAMDASEARRLLALARSHRRLVGCCSTRFLDLPTTQEARRLVDSGALGRVYHTTFIQRVQRFRTGIEYQPSSRWFLDRSKNGGGILMDWAPYDFSMLNAVLSPARVEVLHAWCANPATKLKLPVGTVFDVETHAGASLRFRRRDGSDVHVTYERASCTHGEPRSVVEIEGTGGAVRWEWLMYSGKGELTRSFDRNGKVASRTRVMTNRTGLGAHDRPLVHLWRRIVGLPSLALVNEAAAFNFRCLRAVYDCAATGKPQVVSRRSAP